MCKSVFGFVFVCVCVWNCVCVQQGQPLLPSRVCTCVFVTAEVCSCATPSLLRNQISAKKIIVGKSLTFSFVKIIRRLLLFTRLSYYFTPYNRLTDYSLEVHKLTKSSTLLSFWPAGSIPPPNDWKLTDIFFPIWTLWVRCVPKYRMWWALGDLSTTSGGMGWVSSRDGKHANSKNIFVLFWGAGASLGVLHKF